jgi:ATP-dependent Clp protease ATP-binding subunit ClpB
LKRVIQKELVDPIARQILSGELVDGQVIQVSVGADGLTIGRATLQ